MMIMTPGNKHAEKYYEALRNREQKNMITTISKHSGVGVKSVSKVIDHLLFNYTRFDPSYDITQSLQRLLEGKDIRPEDIIMLHHERLEYELMNRYGHDYNTAHKLANKKYNYERMVT